MSDYSSLIKQLRDEHNPPWIVNPAAKIAADAIEAQAKRIAELEAALELYPNITKYLLVEADRVLGGQK